MEETLSMNGLTHIQISYWKYKEEILAHVKYQLSPFGTWSGIRVMQDTEQRLLLHECNMT